MEYLKKLLNTLSDLSVINLVYLAALLSTAGLLLGGTLAVWGGSPEFWSLSAVVLGVSIMAVSLWPQAESHAR